jgi:hypothetical protein
MIIIIQYEIKFIVTECRFKHIATWETRHCNCN